MPKIRLIQDVLRLVTYSAKLQRTLPLALGSTRGGVCQLSQIMYDIVSFY